MPDQTSRIVNDWPDGRGETFVLTFALFATMYCKVAVLAMLIQLAK